MKLISTLAFATFLVSSTEAFGPARPLQGTAFGISSSTGGGMTMRIGVAEMKRRRKFKSMVKDIQSKEAVQEKLITEETSNMIKSANWKLRSFYLFKARALAMQYDVEVPEGFGVPLTVEERDESEQAKSKVVQAERKAHNDAIPAKIAAAKAERIQKRADKTARREASSNPAKAKKEKPAKKKAAPAPAAEAPAAPAPAAEAPAPAAAPASGGGGEVTPKTIKQLRDATGAGMMDCKRALLETDGDQDEAAENLRAKGLAKADKKASRIAAEGKIAVSGDGSSAVMVEVNCETDFVGKDSSFLSYCERVAGAAAKAADDNVDALMATEVDGESLEVTRQALVSKIGENIQVRRMSSRGGDGKTVGAYVHMNRIGVLVELEGGDEKLAVDVAMHVAAMNPPYARPEDVPGDVVEKEKNFLSEQALESGKPPEIVEKMVEGRIRKYLEEICLVSQPYVRDGDITVEKLLNNNGAKMVGFSRIAVGEGMEKREDDFAAEVAKMAGGQ